MARKKYGLLQIGALVFQTLGKHGKTETGAVTRMIVGGVVREQNSAIVMKMFVLDLQEIAPKGCQPELVRVSSEPREGLAVIAARGIDCHYWFFFLGLRWMLGKLIVHSPPGSEGGIKNSPFSSSFPSRFAPAESTTT